MKRNNLSRFRYLKYGFPQSKKGNNINMTTRHPYEINGSAPFNEMLRGDAADDSAEATNKKILQIVNLAPSETWLENITDVHPMKQIVWASIIQACVFGFMLLSFLLISIATEARDFDFEQIKEDGDKLEALYQKDRAKYSMDFNIKEPQHKYFLIINILDIATTLYAVENRTSLVEGNPLLPRRPKLEELLLHKTLTVYALKRVGLFSTDPTDEWNLRLLNTGFTIIVLSNLHNIHTND